VPPTVRLVSEHGGALERCTAPFSWEGCEQRPQPGGAGLWPLSVELDSSVAPATDRARRASATGWPARSPRRLSRDRDPLSGEGRGRCLGQAPHNPSRLKIHDFLRIPRSMNSWMSRERLPRNRLGTRCSDNKNHGNKCTARGLPESTAGRGGDPGKCARRLSRRRPSGTEHRQGGTLATRVLGVEVRSRSVSAAAQTRSCTSSIRHADAVSGSWSGTPALDGREQPVGDRKKSNIELCEPANTTLVESGESQSCPDGRLHAGTAAPAAGRTGGRRSKEPRSGQQVRRRRTTDRGRLPMRVGCGPLRLVRQRLERFSSEERGTARGVPI
jgi:hypothetical protein